MGTGSGMVQFGRLATFLIAGFLANLKWNYVYFGYGFMLIAFLLVVFLLPADTPNTLRHKSDGQNGHFQKEVWLKLVKNAGFWQLMAITTLFGVVNFLASSHVSLYIEGYGLGRPSMTGILTGFSCAIAGFMGVLFSVIYKRSGNKTHIMVFIIMGIGFVLAGLIVGLPFILIAVAFTMIASAIFLPYTLLCVFKVSDEQTAPMVTALIPTLINAGSFLSPMIMGGLANSAGDGSPATVYLCGGILTLAVGIVLIVVAKWMVYNKDPVHSR
jgi:hypothetical protein